MHIFYGKAPLRAHSFIWTNGKNIAYYKFPEKNDRPKWFFFFQFATISQICQKNWYKGIDFLRCPGNADWHSVKWIHYFLLFEDCLTIISRIIEKVVKCEEVMDFFYYKTIIFFLKFPKFGPLLGIWYERNKDEIWVFSSMGVMQLSIKNEDKYLPIRICYPISMKTSKLNNLRMKYAIH